MRPSRQLPPDASLRQLKIQAKELCKACRDGDRDAIQRIAETHPRFSTLSPAEVAANFALADAQLVISQELGFESWPKLKKHIESKSPFATSMHELVAAGDLRAMREAITRDPESVRQRNEQGLPPLYTAALYRNREAIDLLLEHGAEVDIFACAYLGRANAAEKLLSQDPGLATATTSDGVTALHFAARAGHCDVAEVLLLHHADSNAVDAEAGTPLMGACHAGPWKLAPAADVIELLLTHGAQANLFDAAAMGRTELMQAILDHDPGLIDATDNRGRTALYHAARNSRLAAVKLLVERGADVNRSDAVGIAALHRTSQECSDELIRYLIDHGADAHLCCYVACGDEDGTRHLLARNPDAANEHLYDLSPVQYAIHSWQLGTLRVLLEHGCLLTEADRQHILRISDND